MNEKTICDQCGSEMRYYIACSTCGTICKNCGWSCVTTYQNSQTYLCTKGKTELSK